MGVIKLTFDGANNTSKTDAYVGAYLTDYKNGIIRGLGHELEYSVANSKITFRDGFVSIYGRKVYIEDSTSISIVLDSAKKGYVVLSINTTSNTASMELVESENMNPPLVQTNLLAFDGLYQFPICAYNKTPTSLIIDSGFTRSFIEPLSKILESEETKIMSKVKEEIKPIKLVLKSKTEDTYVYDLSGILKNDKLICFCVSNYFITLPSSRFNSRYPKSFSYVIKGESYAGLISMDMNSMTIQVGEPSHKIEEVYLY